MKIVVSSIEGRELGFLAQYRDKAVFQEANGLYGGLLTCRDSELFELINFESMYGNLGKDNYGIS